MCRISLFLVWCVLYTAHWAAAQAPSVSMEEVDRMRAAGRFEDVRDVLADMRGQNPDNAAVLWRLSRTYVNLGEQAAGHEQQTELYRKGIEIAEEAVRADPNHDEAHLAYAIAAGRLGLVSRTREKIELSRTVKEHVDRAVALDPRNPAALHVRARWNYAIADLGFMERALVKLIYGGLPKASFEAAAQDFERAIALDNRAIHHLELGKTYLKLGREDQARASFRDALDAPPTDPADPLYKQEAAELLQEMGE